MCGGIVFRRSLLLTFTGEVDVSKVDADGNSPAQPRSVALLEYFVLEVEKKHTLTDGALSLYLL